MSSVMKLNPDAVPVTQWPEPMPIEADAVSREPYPLSTMPIIFQECINDVSELRQVPIESIATAALVYTAAAVQAHVDVDPYPRLKFRSPTSLFGIIQAATGDRKSGIDTPFSSIYKEFEANHRAIMEPEIKQYHRAMAIYKERHQGIREAIRKRARENDMGKGLSLVDLERQLEELESSEPIAPLIRDYVEQEPTLQALSYSLAHEFPTKIISAPEGGIWLGGHSMSGDDRTRLLGTLNSIWSGEDIKVKRRTSEDIALLGVRLSTIIQIQPKTMNALMGQNNTGDLFEAIGMDARTLMLRPVSLAGKRGLNVEPILSGGYERYKSRMTQILNDDLPLKENTLELDPALLLLDAEATQLWANFYNTTEEMMNHEGDAVRGYIAKIAEQSARIAAVLHYFEHGSNGEINKETMIAGIAIAQWHLREYKRIKAESHVSPEERKAITLSAWLVSRLTKLNTVQINVSEVARYAPREIGRTKALVTPVLDLLVELNHIRIIKLDRSEVVVINPALIGAKQ